MGLTLEIDMCVCPKRLDSISIFSIVEYINQGEQYQVQYSTDFVLWTILSSMCLTCRMRQDRLITLLHKSRSNSGHLIMQLYIMILNCLMICLRESLLIYNNNNKKEKMFRFFQGKLSNKGCWSSFTNSESLVCLNDLFGDETGKMVNQWGDD